MRSDFEIAKADTSRQLVFGWASVAVDKSGTPVVDSQSDMIDPQTLEDAAYEFVLKFREANDSHAGPAIGQLVESMVFTPEKLAKLGLPADSLPTGWWTGFKLTPDAFAAVADGSRRMFSIEGRATRVEA